MPLFAPVINADFIFLCFNIYGAKIAR